MKNNSYIKQAYIASLLEHPRAENLMKQAFSAQNLEKVQEELAKADQSVTKEDVFALMDDGTNLLDAPRSWKNFGKVADLLKKNGETLTKDDVLLVIKDEKNVLQIAAENQALDKLFDEDLWGKNFDDYQQCLFMTISAFRHDMLRGGQYLDAKRNMTNDGKPLREDRLKEIGIDPFYQMPAAFTRKASFDGIVEKLKSQGEKLTKADVLMPDADGDGMFCSAGFWKSFDRISDMIAQNGEEFSADDFLKRHGYANNMLTRAMENKALDKVFEPSRWIGRLDQMVTLVDALKPAWHSQFKKQAVYDLVAEAEDLTYAALVDIDADKFGKTDLLSPINDTAKDGYHILPLGLKSVWDDFERVESKLDANKEAITLADLRAKSGAHGMNGLMTAAMSGRFDKVSEILEKSGEKLSVNDILDSAEHGHVNVLKILIEQKQLKQLFTPQIWAGRVREMENLWHNIPANARSQVNYQKVLSDTNRATVGKMGQGGMAIKRRRKPGNK